MDEGMSRSRQWIIGQDRALRVTLIERPDGYEARLIFIAGKMRSLLFSGIYGSEAEAKGALLEEVLKVSIGTVHCANWLCEGISQVVRKCCNCRFFWHVHDRYGGCVVTSNSDRTMVSIDTDACDRFKPRKEEQCLE